MIKIVSLFRKLSFYKKVMFSFITLFVIPVLVFSLFFYTSSVTSILQNAQEMVDQRLIQEKNSIEKKLDEYEKVASIISQNSLLNDFLSNSYYEDSEFILFIKNYFNPLISSLVATNPGISDLRFYTNNKNILSYYQFIYAKNYDEQNWFNTMKQKTFNLSPYWEIYHQSHISRNTTQPQKVYSLFHPIVLQAMKENAYLEIEVNPEYLFSQMTDDSTFHSDCILVIDSDKNVIKTSNPSLSGILLKNIDPQIFLNLNENKHMKVKLDNITYSMSITRIEKIDTFILDIVPESEVLQNLSKARNLFFLILISSFVILTTLAYLFTGFLLKRVKNMVKAVHRIQNHDFNIDIPVNGEDEIDELASSINVMSTKINELINKVYKSQIIQKEAELAALQMQINPHFLFNTLEALKMMAELEDQQKISDAIASLGNLMRYALTRCKGCVYLKDEIENIKDYVEIQNLLLNNRLKVVYNIDSDLMLFEFPSLIIQPLIENSITHGYKNHKVDMIIEIDVYRKEQDILLIVRDYGVGMDRQRMTEINEALKNSGINDIPLGKSNGIALKNIDSRIKLKFGNDYGVFFDFSCRSGTTICVKIPYYLRNNFHT